MRLQHRTAQLLSSAAMAAVGLLGANSARAEVQLPAVLSDHMVLQQGMAVPIWGTADKGEEVTVAFGPQKQTTKAGEDGRWAVKLAPLTASDKPEVLVVTGKNKVELKDILVGEVWICSGQSNMEMGIKSVKNGAKEIADAVHPNIRLFTVPKAVMFEPQSEVNPKPRVAGEAKWLACSPENIVVGDWGGFTAAGYFFGRDLHADLKVPIGLIHSSWGGTIAEAWAERSHLEGDADLAPILERREKGQQEYEKQLKKWEADVAEAKAANEAHDKDKPAEPGEPAPVIHPRKAIPKKPNDPAGNPNQASVLYNGMIAPIVPFAVKGAVWYQGESNADRAYQYRKVLPAMIKSWRDVWHEPELDFYIVSLANFESPPKNPGDSTWAELREAQAMTAAQPHNGQALAIDLADEKNPGDIHPKDKQSVGHRLELVALAKTYGQSVDYSGPEYKDFKVEGNKVVLHFKFDDQLHAKGGDTLKGFQIAGEDKKWHWADAKVEANAVEVSSSEVEKPIAVRYDWANNPQGNLYNKADLPTVPFRTDDWPGVTATKR